jgi:cytochrome P450
VEATIRFDHDVCSSARTGLGGAQVPDADIDEVDISDTSYLPDSLLWPLRRNGLDPVEELGRRRAQEPVSRLPVPFAVKAWLVTGYDEVREVLGPAEGFSNDFGNLAGSAGVGKQHDPGGLGFADPPVHTRLRRLLTPEFTMRRLQRLAPRIDAIIAEQLDAMETVDGPVDLWPTFALPIPSLTICELLGVPYEERKDFQRLSTARFDMAGGGESSLARWRSRCRTCSISSHGSAHRQVKDSSVR